MDAQVLVITNGTVVLPHTLLADGAIVIAGEHIAWVGPAAALPTVPDGSKILDVQGAYICPGFVDIHVHGGGGADTMDNTHEAMRKIAQCHAAGGTTSFVATTVTAPVSELLSIMQNMSALYDVPTGGARLVGIHLEGPFIAMGQIGAHNPLYRLDPADTNYAPLLQVGFGVRRMTVAPELPGAVKLINMGYRQGWHMAMGHSVAVGEEIMQGVAAGCRHVTHLFSCGSSLLNVNGYKQAGINESALLYDEITVEVIADGHHLSGHLAAAVARCKGTERTCLVTDAIRAAGMPPGKYELGGLDIIVEDGVAKLPDRSKFAGSVATMAQLVREIVGKGGMGILDAVKMASTTPAQLIGLGHRKGVLAAGCDADVVVLSSTLQVEYTVVGGEVVYTREAGLAGNKAS